MITSHSDTQPVVVARNIHKSFLQGDSNIPALSGVDLTIETGEFVAICGHSGSGKSTLLNVIGTLEIPDDGELILWGNPVRYEHKQSGQLNTGCIRQHEQLRQAGLGFVFQNFNLNPALTALENVAIPLLLTNASPSVRHEKAAALLEQVGLGDRLNHKPGELSGGQQQRVAAARALVTEPRLVLADEPTANLDSHSTEQLVQTLRQLNQTTGTTLLFSTHDERLLGHVDRKVLLHDGKLEPSALSAMPAETTTTGATATGAML